MADSLACPHCGSTLVVKLCQQQHCNSCGRESNYNAILARPKSEILLHAARNLARKPRS